ncbi:prepilin peptidase, partial [Streptomyces lichenis]
PPPIPTPLPVLTSSLLSGLLAAATGPRPELVAWLAAVPVAVLLASVDLAVHRLPDRLTLPLAAGLAALLGGAALLPGHAGSWSGALLGGLVLGTGYAVLFLLNPAGLGFGDVKLALALGTALGWYGWPVLFAGTFAGFLLGAVYGLTLIALRRADRKSAIPFGPFMLGGALLGVLLGALAAHP